MWYDLAPLRHLFWHRMYLRYDMFIRDCPAYDQTSPLHWLLVLNTYLPVSLGALFWFLSHYNQSPFHAVGSWTVMLAGTVTFIAHPFLGVNKFNPARCATELEKADGASSEAAVITAILIYYVMYDISIRQKQDFLWPFLRVFVLVGLGLLQYLSQISLELQDTRQVAIGASIGAVCGVAMSSFALAVRDDYERHRGRWFWLFWMCGSKTRRFRSFGY